MARRGRGGEVGGALSFDGRDDYVEVPDCSSIDLSRYSFEAWISWEGKGDNWQRILPKGPMSGSYENYASFVNREERENTCTMS